jgi:hypothetical protein
VNHIVYHGTAYSPRADPWPGWQFYASVEFNSRNVWWTDFVSLNEYVTRVQSFLQAGTPDHDVLVYYPFYESIAERGTARLAHFGGANPPARGTAFEEAVATLQKRGYTYDFISDAQLAATRLNGSRLVTGGGGEYATLLVPSSRFIPLETWERVVGLARDGANVVAFKGLPQDVAGLADLARRRPGRASARHASAGARLWRGPISSCCSRAWGSHAKRSSIEGSNSPAASTGRAARILSSTAASERSTTGSGSTIPRAPPWHSIR